MKYKSNNRRTSAIPAFSIIETIISSLIISIMISITTVILSTSYNIGKEKNELVKQLEINNLKVALYKYNNIDSTIFQSSFNYQKRIINESLDEISIDNSKRQHSKLMNRLFLIRN